MATGEWLKDLQRAAQITAQREQRGAQLTLGDLERTPNEPRTNLGPTAAAPAAEQRMNSDGGPHAAQGMRRQAAPFTGRDPGRNYRRMYRAACDFYERHNPPTPGDDDGALYWAATTDDMTAIAQQFNDDPFMMNLLCVVFDELEREYKAMRQQTAGA